MKEDKEGIAFLLNDRRYDYFNDIELIETEDSEVDLTQMRKYKKNKLMLGYAVGTDMLSARTRVCVRTLETDLHNLYIIDSDIFDLSYSLNLNEN